MKPEGWPDIGEGVARVGVTSIREWDAIKLRELKNLLVVEEKGEPLVVVVPYPMFLVRPGKPAESAFERMAEQFREFQHMSDDELREQLVRAGYPPPENKLSAVMENMRRQFGPEIVSWWLKECGKRAILT